MRDFFIALYYVSLTEYPNLAVWERQVAMQYRLKTNTCKKDNARTMNE